MPLALPTRIECTWYYTRRHEQRKEGAIVHCFGKDLGLALEVKMWSLEFREEIEG